MLTYPIDRAKGTIARTAASYQAFHDSATCLSSATPSRRALSGRSEEEHRGDTINILDQRNRRRVSTDRLNRVDTLLVLSLEGESGPIPAGKTIPHSYPKTRFRRKRAQL